MGSGYAGVGVDVRKRGIEGFRRITNNIFRDAFCPVVRDPSSKSRCTVLHTDGAGSKPVQSYLRWRETGEKGCFEGLAQDVVAMNVDDIICVGAVPVGFVDYIAVNPIVVPKALVLKELCDGFRRCFALLRKYGLSVSFAGGETADLPDQLRTLDVSGTVSGTVRLSEAVTGTRIAPGDLIVGLRSGGRARYEKKENSGIMCNGITLARHCLMLAEYGRKYPEILEPGSKPYYGRFRHDDRVDRLYMTVGDAILSPTRIFAPAVLEMLRVAGGDITGMVHNTGGGQTKCLRLGRNIRYVKDEPIDPDPIFILIRDEAKLSWREMYEDFNMGTGFEVIVRKKSADRVLDVAERFGIGAKVIGRCEREKGGNSLVIAGPGGKIVYR
ncbi:MAG: AIR synthase related protein [Candidatus Hadarchaeales archaeon]